MTLAQFLDRQWNTGAPSLFAEDRAVMDSMEATASFLAPAEPHPRGILPSDAEVDRDRIRRGLMVLTVPRQAGAKAPIRPYTSSMETFEDMQGPLNVYVCCPLAVYADRWLTD